MNAGRLAAFVRAGFALLVLVSVGAQVGTLLAARTFDPSRFFAFFTIQSNLLGAVLLLWLALNGRAERSRAVDLLRGAAAVYLTVTFVVVILLLSSADLQLAIPWVDFVLHKLFPVVVVADWLLAPPVRRVGAKDALAWSVYPVAWLVFSVARGAVDGWYPYPFLDPAHGGYATVAGYVIAILVGFAILSAVAVVLGNAARRRSSPAARGSMQAPGAELLPDE